MNVGTPLTTVVEPVLIVAVGLTLAITTEVELQLPVVSSSAAQTFTTNVPSSPYVCCTENVSVASGLLFSRTPESACAPAPSPKSIVAVSGSSQPGSVTEPEI